MHIITDFISYSLINDIVALYIFIVLSPILFNRFYEYFCMALYSFFLISLLASTFNFHLCMCINVYSHLCNIYECSFIFCTFTWKVHHVLLFLLTAIVKDFKSIFNYKVNC